MKDFKTIKELHEAVKAGKVDESKLVIMLDNDATYFRYGPAEDKNGDDLENGFEVHETNGYYDVEKLYPLLFPKAYIDRA